jgi:hypothetical protein
VAVADLPHPLEVARRGDEAAARVLHRLEVHGGDGVRSLREDHRLDGVGARERVVGIGAVRGERVRHVPCLAVEEGEEGPLDRVEPGDAERPERGAVVRGLAGDDLGALRLAAGHEELTGQLPRGLHGLAPTRGEEHPVEVAGCHGGEPSGQLDGGGVGVGPEGEVAELGGLGARRVGQLLAAVAGLHDEEAGQAVEVPPAVAVPDVGALPALDDREARACFPRQAREVQPEVVGRGRRQLGAGHRHQVPPVG